MGVVDVGEVVGVTLGMLVDAVGATDGENVAFVKVGACVTGDMVGVFVGLIDVGEDEEDVGVMLGFEVGDLVYLVGLFVGFCEGVFVGV